MAYADGARRSSRTPAATRSRSSGTPAAPSALGVGFDEGEVPRPRARSAAASRSGWCWSTCSPGPTRCCCSTSRTTSSTYPGKIWLEERIRESPKTILFISHDRELLANTATRVVTVELGRRRQHRVDAPGRVRVVPPGAARPVRALRGAAPALGRGARQAAHADADVQEQGGVQLRHGLALPRRPDPAAQVRGGRAADRPAARAAGDACGSRAAAPASARWSARSSS